MAGPDTATLLSSQQKQMDLLNAPNSQLQFLHQQSMHSGIGGNIRDDFSQRSALKSSAGKKKNDGKLGVNWGPSPTAPNRLQSAAKNSVVSRLPIQTGNAIDKMSTQLSVVPENALAGQQLAGGGKDPTQLNLGNRYSAFQEQVRQRLEILKDSLTRPKMSAKQRSKKNV